MTAPMDCQLIGQWRIIEADLWDRNFLDLGQPARLVIRDDGSLEIEFAYHHGDEAQLKARRATFSATC